MVRVMEQWNRLPREVAKSPMEILKTHLDTYVTYCKVHGLAGGLELMTS